MKIFTVWEPPQDNLSMPSLLDAVDEYTIESNGQVPDSYAEKLGGKNRELVIEVSESAVRNLFQAPTVKGTTK